MSHVNVYRGSAIAHQIWPRSVIGVGTVVPQINKSSAVAEMGDRGHIDKGLKEGDAVRLSRYLLKIHLTA